MVMGLNPLVVGKLSLWKFHCAVTAWNHMQAPSKPPVSGDMPQELFEQIGTTMQWEKPT
jgi:hypothetical protein